MATHPSNVVKANKEVVGVKVMNAANDDLGKIEEVMLDKTSGKVAYVVLESGSVLGMGGKLFALPWTAMQYDAKNDCFKVNIDKEKFTAQIKSLKLFSLRDTH